MATAKSMRTLWVAGITLVGFTPALRAQETLAGVGAAGGIAAGMGAISATNIRPGDVTKNLPSGSGGDMGEGTGGMTRGGGAGGATAGTAAMASTVRSVRFNSISGHEFLNEIAAGGHGAPHIRPALALAASAGCLFTPADSIYRTGTFALCFGKIYGGARGLAGLLSPGRSL